MLISYVSLGDGGGFNAHWNFAYHNISMGKKKWSMDWGDILGLESNTTNVFTQLIHLEKDATTTMVLWLQVK
jgi:hypothetical protein